MERNWKYKDIGGLNLRPNGYKATVAERRKDGEIWLLNHRNDGVHVCGVLNNGDELYKTVMEWAERS